MYGHAFTAGIQTSWPSIQPGKRAYRLSNTLDCLQTLNRIEEEVARLSVPLAFADQLYHLRMNIELVRQKVRQAQTKLEP